MLCPDLTYESDQSASEGAEGRGRRTFALHITPVNFGAHVVVASGILRMRQAISAEVTSPVPFIPIRGPRLPKILAISKLLCEYQMSIMSISLILI
jgi:hypothetical protein